MILGKIVGKTTTTDFKFKADKDITIYQYVQIPIKDKFALAQITEIEKDSNDTIAYCSIIGYRDGSHISQIRTPLEPGIEVLEAESDFIRDTLGLVDEKGAYIGKLDGKNLKVFLDINKMLTKHVSILAKSGSGKSYASGVLLEELLDKKIPILIIDPHGEYSTLKYPNSDKTNMDKFEVKPKSYLKQIQEYTPDTKINTDCKALKLSTKDLTPSEILQLLPAKLNNAQKGLLYSAIKSIGGKTDFDEIIMSLETEENSAKWTLINVLEYVQKLGIFSDSPTYLEELIQPGKASIINLKGVQPELSEVVVYKLVKDLFDARKQNKIPPFFLVLEESHNFCPERGFGEAKSSSILRTVASVDYSEPIMIKKRKNTKICSIGEFIDNLIINKNIAPNKSGLEIAEIKSKIYTPAFDKNLKIKYKPIKKVIRHKIKEPLYELTLEKGKKVKITSSHSIFVLRDNIIQDVPTTSIKNNDYVIVPINMPKNKSILKSIPFSNPQNNRKFKLPSQIPLNKDFMTLLGYFVAEGSSNGSSIRFTLNYNEKAYIDDILKHLKNLFGLTPYVYKRKELSKVEIITNKTSLAELFSDLCGKYAYNSKVPSCVFNVSGELKAAFIKGCFNGGGYLRTRKGNKGGRNIEISYKTVSKDLAESLSYLLLSIGIHSAIYEIKPNKPNHKIVYQLVTNGKHGENLLEILNNNKHYSKIKKSMDNKNRHTNSLESLIPTEPFKLAYKNYKPVASDNSISERMCIRRKRANREDLINFISYLERKSRIKPDKKVINFLRLLCNSEIGFLKVKKIKEVKSSSEYVYDLSIGESENFVSGRGGIILHNSEGRKFGLGLCVISQRPAKVDKNVLSQATTQIILKVTNPNDIKAITSSVEGLTSGAEKEISNIPIGTAMLVGTVSTPLLVNIRPRKSKHGGEAVNIMQDDKDFAKEIEDSSELMPVIKPKLTKQDLELMSTEQIKDKIKTVLIPCVFLMSKDYNFLVNLNNNQIISNIDNLQGVNIPDLDLSQSQLKVFKAALLKREFTPAELFAETNISFSEINDIVNGLEQKDYLLKDRKFKIAPRYRMFSELEKYACYEKIDFSKIKFDEKLDSKVNVDEVKKKFSKFLDINESREAFLVNYKISR